MTLREPSVSPRCLAQRKRRRNRHSEPRRLYSTPQACELADARRAIEWLNGQAATLARRWFHAIWKRDPAAPPNGIEQPAKWLSSRKREHRIDTVGRKLDCCGLQVITPPVRSRIGAKTTHERDPVSPGGRCEDAGAAVANWSARLPDATRRAMNHDSLTALHVKRVVKP